eukprot:528530-Amphidinium_carterae.1
MEVDSGATASAAAAATYGVIDASQNLTSPTTSSTVVAPAVEAEGPVKAPLGGPDAETKGAQRRQRLPAGSSKATSISS